MCRELLLLESSDWQFLITTEAARDYADARFKGHLSSFQAIERMWQLHRSGGTLSSEDETRLKEIESQDSVFADIDPSLWVAR